MECEYTPIIAQTLLSASLFSRLFWELSASKENATFGAAEFQMCNFWCSDSSFLGEDQYHAMQGLIWWAGTHSGPVGVETKVYTLSHVNSLCPIQVLVIHILPQYLWFLRWGMEDWKWSFKLKKKKR